MEKQLFRIIAPWHPVIHQRTATFQAVSRLREIFKSILQKDSFAQNVVLMSSASAWGILIQFAFAPILSRIYEPEVYGLFSIFITLLNVTMTFMMVGYNRALLLPKDRASLQALLRLSILASTAIAIAASLIFAIFGASITGRLSANELGYWVYFIAPIALLGAFDQFALSLGMQQKAFKRMSVLSIPINAGSKLFNVAYGGWISASVTGLVLTHMLTSVLRIWSTLQWAIQKPIALLTENVSRARLLEAWRSYSDYPKYVVWGNLLNILSGQVPTLLLALYLADTTGIGWYAYAVMMLELPVRLLSAGISNVFLQESNEHWENNPEFVRQKTLRIFYLIIYLTAIPTTLLYFFGPDIFALLLGKHWREAGMVASALSVAYMLRYISVPISSLFVVTRNEARAMYFQVILLILRTAGIVLPGLLGLGYMEMIIGYAIANIAAYAVYTLWIFALIQSPLRRVLPAVIAITGFGLLSLYFL